MEGGVRDVSMCKFRVEARVGRSLLVPGPGQGGKRVKGVKGGSTQLEGVTTVSRYLPTTSLLLILYSHTYSSPSVQMYEVSCTL